MVVPVCGYGQCQGCDGKTINYKGCTPTKWCGRTCRDRDYRAREPSKYQRRLARERIRTKLKRGKLTRAMLVCSGVLAPAPLTPRA